PRPWRRGRGRRARASPPALGSCAARILLDRSGARARPMHRRTIPTHGEGAPGMPGRAAPWRRPVPRRAARRGALLALVDVVLGLLQGQLPLGLLHLAAGHDEVLLPDRDRIAVLVTREANDVLFDQAERHLGRLLGLERPGTKVVIAAEGLEPPGIHSRSPAAHPRRDEVARREDSARLPARKPPAGLRVPGDARGPAGCLTPRVLGVARRDELDGALARDE